MGNSTTLLALHIAYVLITIATNISGFETTKNASSSVRCTFNASLSFVIWIVSMIVGWEIFDWLETPVKLLGLAVAAAGVLIYNNVWIVVKYLRKANVEKDQKYIEMQNI